MSSQYKIYSIIGNDGKPLSEGSIKLYYKNENDLIEGALLEGRRYDYVFESTKYKFKELVSYKNKFLFPSIKDQGQTGVLSTLNLVGNLILSVVKAEDDDNKVGEVSVDIQDRKLNNDHEQLLADIAKQSTELMMLQGSVVSRLFNIKSDESAVSLYQKFAFLNSMFKKGTIDKALLKIYTNPVQRWQSEQTEKEIAAMKKMDNKGLRQMVSSGNRIKCEIPGMKKIGLTSLPRKINIPYKEDSLDTPENRFIKFALEDFCRITNQVFNHPNATPIIRNSAEKLRNELTGYLRSPFFKNIKRPKVLNFNNPVLQRKEGYKDILAMWIRHSCGAALNIPQSEETGKEYNADIRTVASLYEYWCGITLLKTVRKCFSITDKPIFVGTTVQNDMNINLTTKWLDTNIVFKGQKGKLSFSYNKSFRKDDGSWSIELKPDFTLEFIFEQLNIHFFIHFDAKYKYDLENRGTSMIRTIKKEDIYKMHTYRDGIYKSVASYALYPGDELHKYYNKNNSTSIGAFPLRVSSQTEDCEKISVSIKETLRDQLYMYLY